AAGICPRRRTHRSRRCIRISASPRSGKAGSKPRCRERSPRTTSPSIAMLDGDPFVYFSDLLALLVVVLPASYLLPWVRARQGLLAGTGAYLIFLIAPRLLLFYVGFWALVYVLQRGATLFRDHPAGWVWTSTLIGTALTPMVVWKLAPEWAVTQFN